MQTEHRFNRPAIGQPVEETVTLATWNVKSLAVRLPQLLDWLNAHQPKAMVQRETKFTADKFPASEIEAAGYEAQWFAAFTIEGRRTAQRSRPIELASSCRSSMRSTRSVSRRASRRCSCC
jgi:exonuclease III